MTIIASYDIYGCKVIFADTLITSQEINENKPILPTLGKIDSTRINDSFHIAGNLQKIQILSDYCVIAYAGSVYLAHQYITALNDILKERRLLISDIENIYNSIDVNNDLAIIYLYNSGDENIISGGLNCVNTLSDVLGDVIYRGSGEQAISDYIKWIDDNAEIFRPSPDEVVANGVRIVIEQIAKLQMAEISSSSTPESIKDCFGSSYEIVSFYDGKFNKIDLTYAFIELTYNHKTKNVDINYPYLILSNYIEDDFLVHERYQKNNHDYLVDICFVEYDYNKIFIPSLLKYDKLASNITQENKLNNFNFCCFIFHDKFKYGCEIWQSIVIRSDEPPITIERYNGGDLYQVFYSSRVEKQIVNFIKMNYL
ncbi:TPA: hypothetical protein ACMDRZ_000771 [Vibrio cholerae]|uniref:hypothetical protein n=2 Tax=Vibrio cholerae TaxID=666 RepID=UPI001582CBD6|nr:hypothetical protein [Vibrio cholerae]QKU62667.1 hypothetical protein HPY17_04725 [Vibrio cholerae]QKU66551.1 hypothetical protein HPY10_04730 [Vibrio cholerae]